MSESLPFKRCAIYSRSSVEKDNRDPFDSVRAQFTACAEFIGPQVGKGWGLVDTIYEDRGYSGSHMKHLFCGRTSVLPILWSHQRNLMNYKV